MSQSFVRFVVISFVVPVCLMMNGCASQTKTPMSTNIEPLSSFVGSFNDLEIPSEMEMDKDQSISIKTDSFMGGIIVFEGKVEINSLKDYVISSMKSHKWKQVGEASSKEIMMAFIKPNKTCMITLSEGFGGTLGKTYLKMYVTVDVAAGKRMNAFGEPVN
ncbi:MAG: hypothetical protein CR981_00710 [Proteobacteria bacterium]|nr:MAG: hypothetical protein CR981_00710 [Pseudomonadota bacterium]